MTNAVNPAKCGLEWMRIELAMLDFCPGAKQALPATVRIDGIDHAAPLLTPGGAATSLCDRSHQCVQWLAMLALPQGKNQALLAQFSSIQGRI